MINPKYVGITGPAGAGKDTVGKWLALNRGYNLYAFARPLKAGLAAMGMPEPVHREDKEKEIPGMGFTWRDAAQKLGTEWGRSLNPDIWNNLGRKWLLEQDRGAITDVRFENEAAMIRSLGGIILHVTGRQAELGQAKTHVSESGVKLCWEDFTIDNSGSETQLHIKLQKLFYYE